MTRVEKIDRSARYSTSRASAALTQTRSAGSRRGSQRSSDTDRLSRQSLVIGSALNRHGAVGQRVRIREKGVRQQKFTVERLQCRCVSQQVRVKKLRGEPVIAGAQHGIQ